jgi:hypothetical protein
MSEQLVRWLGRAAPLGLGLLFTALWLSHRGFWLDDAFITFRYARNLADGLGPVFNPGEAVEGTTTFLWMLACAAAFAALDEAAALLAIKLSGLLLGLAVLWRCFTFPHPDSEPGATGPSANPRWLVGLLAVNPVFVANCGDGLETPLFMLALVECARQLVHPPSWRSGARLGLWTAAAAATRPEALPLLLVWPGLVFVCTRKGRQREGRRAALGAWTAGFALTSLPPVIGLLAFRLAYYGLPFPNTFYAKATGDLTARLGAGLHDVLRFASVGVGAPPLDLWIAFGLAVAGSALLLRRHAPGAGTFVGGLGVLVLFRVAFDVWSGSEFMGTFRFLAPALPPLFVLADEGWHALGGPGGRPSARWTALLGIAALACSLAGSRANVELRSRYQQGLEQAHVALGRWLRETRAPVDRVAVGDAGAIPFYSGLPVIDLWGLSDSTIARLPGEYGDRPGTADYALARAPELIVLWNLEPIRDPSGALRLAPGPAFDREIAEHPEFRHHYRFVRQFVFRPRTQPGNGYYLVVFERASRGRAPDR